jgi:hypothetical protein
MKNILPVLFFLSSVNAMAQTDSTSGLKNILLGQFKYSYNVEDWFVPVSRAIDSLTPEQANWMDARGNHSIGQLTAHLLFWSELALNDFHSGKTQPFDARNSETFMKFDKTSWPAMVKRLNEVLTQWEREIAAADDAKLKQWYDTIVHVSTHNANHAGK